MLGLAIKILVKKELLDRDFYKVFDKLFDNYTLQRAQGFYTMQDTGTVVKEDTFILTTFIKPNDFKAINEIVFDSIQILKDRLNRESILVEICKPEIMFL